MSNQARRYQRNSNTRKRKTFGESDNQPKQKFVDERHERSKNIELKAKTKGQSTLLSLLRSKTMIVADGAAGTGKTYCATAHAAKEFLGGKFEKIVIYRAYQPLANRTVGFLKGSEKDKLLPYMVEQIHLLEDFLGKGAVDVGLSSGTIELGLLEAVRGRSFDNTFILVDEAQLLTPAEIQALTTRVGEGSQMVFIGDSNQIDNPSKAGGLKYLANIVSKYCINDVGFVNFTSDDCVRSGIVREFLLAYDADGYL